MERRPRDPSQRASAIAKRDTDPGVQGTASKRTRVDDTDPGITFSPGPSPYVDQQQSAWVVINNDAACNGSAVMSNRPDAQLTFNFFGDSLALGLLYKATGVSAKLTLEDGRSYPLEVSPAEAAASATNGDSEALQKKIFRLTGFSCANHTATLTPDFDGGRGDPSQAQVYFDGYSFPSSDSPEACTPDATSTSTATNATPTASVSPDTSSSHLDDNTSEFAGIGAGVAVLGFILALVAIILDRRHKRRKAATIDLPDRSYTTERKQSSFATLKMPLSMMKRSEPLALQHEPIFRPRGIHALAHEESSASVQIVAQPSFPEPSPAHAAFLLLPAPPGEHIKRIDDASCAIGRSLLHLSSEPRNEPRESQQGSSKLQYEKTKGVLASPTNSESSVSGPLSWLVGGHALERTSKVRPPSHTLPVARGRASRATTPSKSPHRPNTASAVDRLRAEARQLGIRRALSPFDRHRPTTTSSAATRPLQWDQSHPTTAPVDRVNGVRRNSTSSGDTHWSRASADESALDTHRDREWSKSQLEIVKADKTTDSEAEMWISKKIKRRNSVGGSVPPKRPPKSPFRPSTGGAAPLA